jgi:hypothetical protein
VKWPFPMPPPPTLAEMLDSCVLNRSISEQEVQRFKQALDREQSGPGPQRSELQRKLSQHTSDAEHWGDYVTHYRARVAQEGKATRPRAAAVLVAQFPPPAPDRRLPREPGADDEELPF